MTEYDNVRTDVLHARFNLEVTELQLIKEMKKILQIDLRLEEYIPRNREVKLLLISLQKQSRTFQFHIRKLKKIPSSLQKLCSLKINLDSYPNNSIDTYIPNKIKKVIASEKNFERRNESILNLYTRHNM